MPNSVERALADALSLEHADIPWTLPASLPPVGDLRRAIEILAVAPADARHVAWCLGKLTLAFEANGRLDAESTKLRAVVWLEANGDLGDELWSIATLAAIQGSQWMPKPAEFRKLVQARLEERHRRLQRCRAMLDAQAQAAAGANGPKAFEREPEPVRLRGSRDAFRRIGNIVKAAHYERRLAAVETRAPEPWALDEERDTP